jgi:hypothetical protein
MKRLLILFFAVLIGLSLIPGSAAPRPGISKKGKGGKMKQIRLFLVFLFFFTMITNPKTLTIEKVGEWGRGFYNDFYIKGTYAYCCSGSGGLDIVDIRKPGQPKLIGNYSTGTDVRSINVTGNYAFLESGGGEMQIVDVANPIAPVLIGAFSKLFPGNAGYIKDNYFYGVGTSNLRIIDISRIQAPLLLGEIEINGTPSDVVVKGNYAYVATSDYLRLFTVAGLQIIDVANPRAPKLVGTYDAGDNIFIASLDLKGDYAYLMHYSYLSQKTDLLVLDIFDPSHPVKVRTTDINSVEDFAGADIQVRDDYAYVALRSRGLRIIDISTPSLPILAGTYDDPRTFYKVHVSGNYAYVGQEKQGLKILDVSNPLSPTLAGHLDESGYGGTLRDVFVSGHHAYLADFMGEFKIVDIAMPSSPALVGSYRIPPASGNLNDIYVSGNYAYLTAGGEGFLYILDISNPNSPRLAGVYDPVEPLSMDRIFISGNYAYIASYTRGLLILDISNPAAPVLKKEYSLPKTHVDSVYVSGHHAFLACEKEGLKIIDVSDPVSPKPVAQYNASPVFDVVVNGNYAYLQGADSRLSILNISQVSSPVLVGTVVFPFNFRRIFASGDYVYMACWENGVRVIDVSTPASPVLVGGYRTPGRITGVWAVGHFIYAVNDRSGKFSIFERSPSAEPPRIYLNRTRLTFATDNNGPGTGTQSISVTNRGGANLNWQVAADRDWLGYTPSAGMDAGEIYVSINSQGLSAGTYNGSLTISDLLAVNSPQVVPVTLTVYKANKTSAPFGEYATPLEGSIIRSSVPFTGWVLDDTGIQSVQLFREEGKSLVYLGDAVLVEGARPDVEQAYPGYPMNYKAGWGYMLLTYFLPHGNGTFTIHAIATDLEGNQVTLGTKTVIVDNTHTVKPFGAIDTPAQGGTAWSSDYVNFAWALAPQPSTIPVDGSTITVWVDGVPYGKPVYNSYRPDIAVLFPGYNNSEGAGGYLHLDTTSYENGVHTISWSVGDDAGNIDGIGSRYFTIKNAGKTASQDKSTARDVNPALVPLDYSSPILVKKGYKQNITPHERYPGESGNITIAIKELERLEIHFSGETRGSGPLSTFPGPHANKRMGYLVVGRQLRALPPGSVLDIEGGIFYWMPGPGFVGTYRFVFLEGKPDGEWRKIFITVNILPQYTGRGD